MIAATLNATFKLTRRITQLLIPHKRDCVAMATIGMQLDSGLPVPACPREQRSCKHPGARAQSSFKVEASLRCQRLKGTRLQHRGDLKHTSVHLKDWSTRQDQSDQVTAGKWTSQTRTQQVNRPVPVGQGRETD